MTEFSFQHSEAFLQWIWENTLFDFNRLKTTCGKEINILEPGSLNTSDGPDFKNGVFQIGGIKWYGDVEIHKKSKHWNHHGHQQDSNFNSVVLHVVVEEAPKPVFTKNGSSPYALNLQPYLSPNLNQFINSFEWPAELPCSASFHFISEEAFHKQIEKAHIEYFEKKTNDFLHFYDPGLLPSRAWKHALILSIWDGLGISHNREAMQSTGMALLNNWNGHSVEEGIEIALEIGGFGRASSKINWNYKSVRPANHPRNRIAEAVGLSHLILKENFRNLLSPAGIEIWSSWAEAASLTNSSRINILFGTVFLPSLYMLGNLFAHTELSKEVLAAWKSLKTPIPASLLKQFNSLGLKDRKYQKKLGAVHQYKSYCKSGKCSECYVLKKAIQS